MKYFLLFFFLTFQHCSKPKTVLICGDHICVNKSEAKQYFENNLSIEVKIIDKKRKELRESITSIAPIFSEKPYFMSDDFTIVDCCVCPILWRLPLMGIDLPKTKTLKPLFAYRDRLYERESVMDSLSEQEKEMV